jgi:hypothetical protein
VATGFAVIEELLAGKGTVGRLKGTATSGDVELTVIINKSPAFSFVSDVAEESEKATLFPEY